MAGQRSTAANSTFAIGGVSCSADSFVVAESFVLRIKFSGKNPAHRKSANRQTVSKLNIFVNNLRVYFSLVFGVFCIFCYGISSRTRPGTVDPLLHLFGRYGSPGQHRAF